MTEQWQELKETIIEMRDNDGTGTQQETCKFLANLMDVLEKQMQEPCGNCVNRQAVLNKINEVCFSEEWAQFRFDYGSNGQRDLIIDYIKDLPPVNPQEPKTGHWIEKDGFDGDVYYDCSECGESWSTIEGTPWDNEWNYCPSCGCRMVEPQRK